MGISGGIYLILRISEVSQMNPSLQVLVSPHWLQREPRVTSSYVDYLLLEQHIPYMSVIGTVEGNTQ